ncbi:hypothetical protein LTR70_010398, partial [Exophiala xenobiotica]
NIGENISVTASTKADATPYTTFTTTATVTVPDSDQLVESTYTFTNTVTNPSFFASLQASSVSASSAATTEPTPMTASSLPNNEGGLSKGAKIGIGVGVSLGALTALVIIALVWRARRCRQKLNGAHATDFGTSGNKAELPNKDLPRTHGRSELHEQRAPVELDAAGQSRKAELAGAEARAAELDEKGTGTSTTERSLEK